MRLAGKFQPVLVVRQEIDDDVPRVGVSVVLDGSKTRTALEVQRRELRRSVEVERWPPTYAMPR